MKIGSKKRREEYRAIEGRGDFIGHGWRGEGMIVPKGDLIPNPEVEKVRERRSISFNNHLLFIFVFFVKKWVLKE